MDRIEHAARAHVAGALLADDITMLSIRRAGSLSALSRT
jgi:hypothetical protein